MFRRMFVSLMLVLICVPLMVSAASRDDAQALAEKARVYVESNGIESSRTAMHDKNGMFIDGELYVFVLDFEGSTLVHGANPKLVGKNLSAMKDPNGRYFVKEMAATASDAGSGWVSYMWKHPVTQKLTPKVSYVIKIGSMDAYVGVGIYE